MYDKKNYENFKFVLFSIFQRNKVVFEVKDTYGFGFKIFIEIASELDASIKH